MKKRVIAQTDPHGCIMPTLVDTWSKRTRVHLGSARAVGRLAGELFRNCSGMLAHREGTLLPEDAPPHR
jgi:hypothetical protein